MRDVMTQAQLAEYLSVSRSTIALWRNKGKGPKFVRLGGRTIRYLIDDVREYLASNARHPRKENE